MVFLNTILESSLRKQFCNIFPLQLSELPPVKEAIESLETHGINYDVFDRVRIEPTDSRQV